MYNLGFIGMGNMASAILKGALAKGYLDPKQVWIYDVHPEKTAEMAAQTGVHAAASMAEMAEHVQLFLMAVKPNAIPGVVKENKELLKDKGIISVALGWTHARYCEILHKSTRVAFIMPNTPCLVGEGASTVEETNSLTADELAFGKGIFESVGKVFTVPTELMNVAGSLGGCGPALLYMVMEGLADGAVLHGMPRKLAYDMAAQMVLGSAKMVLETGEHPGALKDSVCSPGGSTIRAVRALENAGTRAAFIDAIDSAVLLK